MERKKGHGRSEDIARLSERAGRRYFRPAQASSTRRAYRAGEGALWGFHDADPADFSGRAVGGGGGDLSFGMFFVGAGEVGFAAVAVIGFGG